jgi:hypothetical protein
MIAGSGMCLIRSQTFAQLHGASSNSLENRPPTLALKKRNERYMITSASRKFGTAMPMKPIRVKM